MSANSSIEWTDATWNPTKGCDKISPGCGHCYAETFAERFRGVPGHVYERGFDPREAPEHLDAPLRWKKPRRIFVNSMSDLFHEAFSDEYIAACFGVMAAAPQHTFQILTKRPERMRAWFRDYVPVLTDRQRGIGAAPNTPCALIDAAFTVGGETPTRKKMLDYGHHFQSEHDRWPLPNVWLGVSVEDQKRADERIPVLLDTPAAVRFLSCEPLLGAVALRRVRTASGPGIETFRDALSASSYGAAWHEFPSIPDRTPLYAGHERVDWVIVGGESGPGARACDVAWIRSIVEQCKAASVPVFVKQLGALPIEAATLTPFIGGKSRKGNDPAEWPADLRVREMPEVRR